MWPRVRFHLLKLFDLRVSDLALQAPYFVRLSMDGYAKMGDDLFIGLLNVPDMVDYFCGVCPERADWLKKGVANVGQQSPERVYECEARVVAASCPWNLGMTKEPAVYDALPWSYWDPNVIYDRIDLSGKTVLDIGAGTGQVTIRCAPYAARVLALEPVGRLRDYIERKMRAAGFNNVQTLAGILEAIPLKDASVDAAILSNGSFGWNPEAELRELDRVTKADGVILMLGPCNHGDDRILSAIRTAGGFEEFEFEVPCDGMKPAFIKRKG